MGSSPFDERYLVHLEVHMLHPRQHYRSRNPAVLCKDRLQPLIIPPLQILRNHLGKLLHIGPAGPVETKPLDKNSDHNQRTKNQRIHHKTAGTEQMQKIHSIPPEKI